MNQLNSTQTLDAPTAILQRRSIKSFQGQAIEPDLLKKLIELSVAAPSSWNLQSWRIVIVTSPEQKVALAEAAFGQKQILEAPVTFVFAGDSLAWPTHLPMILEEGWRRGVWNQEIINRLQNIIPNFQFSLGEKSREYAIKDAMIAATHLVIAAESLGLSTCMMNGWDEAKVKQVIGAENEPGLAIAVLVTVGYAAESRQNPGRLPFSQNIAIDTLTNPYQE